MKKSILVLACAVVALMFASCDTTYNLTDNNTHLLTVASSAYT